MKININIEPSMSISDYWEYHMKQEKVRPLKRACHDCAITTGFYIGMADELNKESPEIVSAVIDTWFCHNHGNRGCAGVRDYLKIEK